MINRNKLKGKMVENGINAKALSKKIGIDMSTFYRKLQNDGDTFLVKEVDLMARELNLTGDEINSIFFADFVASNATSCTIG